MKTLATILVLATATFSHAEGYRYWPKFPAPQKLWRVKAEVKGTDQYVLQSLAGLCARRALHGGPAEYVWIDGTGETSKAWYSEVVRLNHATVSYADDVWDLLTKLQREGVVKGYVLYRPEDSSRPVYSPHGAPSPNAGTMACGPLESVLIPEGQTNKVSTLPMTLDARELTESAVFQQFKSKLNRKVVALIDPKASLVRAEAISMDAPVAGAEKTTFSEMLEWADPDIPVLGWCTGDEWEYTSLASKHGAFMTASNWCSNLTAMAGTPVAQPRPSRKRTYWDLDWTDNVHYVSFIVSDGDNVQWLTGGFFDGKWWGSPSRGAFGMGWTACQADLAQVAPPALSTLSRTASINDDLVLMSGGYYYPDVFPKDALTTHARRLNSYIKECGITAVSCLTQKWDSPRALDAYQRMLGEWPTVEGIMPLQYAPYNAGLGKLAWVGDRPVVSARCMMWADLRSPNTGTPTQVAAMLNSQKKISGKATEANFSWVTVHAWSDFPSEGSEGKLSGLSVTARCVANLDSQTRVVTPTDFLRLMRLRLQPKSTLDRLIKQLEADPKKAWRAKPARKAWAKGDWANAFRLARSVARS